ncbi:MAG: 2'-5' RNA ligase family protein [Hamadaea sp.]|nr:2'-5' RNA ligase family protein [Hamadaea sp.]NUT06296.1 2'-5' RNA ligase family protein [Hamadaea sp.]
MIAGGTDDPRRDSDGYSPVRKGAAMTQTVRIGVAVDVPPPWGPQLTRHRIEAGDPLGAAIPAHVTLLGPTEVDATDLAAIEGHLATVAAEHAEFELLLRGTGTFRPITEVVFVAVAAGISECEQLAAAITATPPLQRPRHYPYHPHVTVAQDVPEPALDDVFEKLAGFEARFDVSGFTLFTHTGDIKSPESRWHPQRDYRLAGPPIPVGPPADRPGVAPRPGR